MRNPVRRSRKIGKTQGGRVSDGKAWEKWSRVFSRTVWDELSESSDECRVLVENPSRDFIHPCDSEEYLGVLNRLPRAISSPVKAIVLRRTPKLDVKLGIDARKRYLCVILNSFPASLELKWGSPPSAGTKRHYDPWCREWRQKGNAWVLKWTIDEVRRYYLYHLFLHEVGHFHQPDTNKQRVREEFAENFALEWATRLGVLNANT